MCVCQILTRRLRFRLERAPGETALIDRTGRMLKMEPLATVESLEQYLLKMVRSCCPLLEATGIIGPILTLTTVPSAAPPGGQAVVRL